MTNFDTTPNRRNTVNFSKWTGYSKDILPLGHIFSRAELTRMAEVCIENNVTIVSDEIHSELSLGGATF